MRKIIVVMHVSLDGFVAGPNGEMDWITVNEEIFSFGKQYTDGADAALYGKNTFHMMDGYWPTAADEPDASQHDIDHSSWYNRVEKYVVAASPVAEGSSKIITLGSNFCEDIVQLKKQQGKNIVIYGSPRLVHALTEKNIIDDYVLFVNPVVLGEGVSFFPHVDARKKFTLQQNHAFSSGVICLHYKIL